MSIQFRSQAQNTRVNAGSQDNNSLKSWQNDNTVTGDWMAYVGGDGMMNRIDPTNDRKFYGCSQNGGCRRFFPGSNNGVSMTIPGARKNWVAPLEFGADPRFVFGASETAVALLSSTPGEGDRNVLTNRQIAATREIRRDLPDTEVLALTSVLEDASVVNAVRAGAIGYLLKNTEADELCRAIKAAAEGQVQLSPEAAARLMREVRAPESPEALTARDRADLAGAAGDEALRCCDYVCIHPGSQLPSRRWHPERFAAVADALAPLGSEYCSVLEKGLLAGRWCDRYPNQGKQSGAFSSGSYDSPPYILMNYNPDVFNDAWREQSTNCTVSRMLQRLVVDNWSRDRAFAEGIDVLNKIYAKYA